jgi:hypothetical protein
MHNKQYYSVYNENKRCQKNIILNKQQKQRQLTGSSINNIYTTLILRQLDVK